ncbi:MAG: acyloxyacyl hydrolase [Candidatus Solibacter sp.]
MTLNTIFVGLFLTGACFAQNWVIGAGVGYGAYKNATITSSAGTADAGFRNTAVFTTTASEDLFEHFSGEFRYIYHSGASYLQSDSVKGEVPAQSHTFVYDVLFHVRPRAERIRPFLAGGVGAKYYDTTGSLPSPQPLRNIASQTIQSQWKPVFDFGGGVKLRVASHVVVSGEFRDYLSLFPERLFSLANGATHKGILHQFTPMVTVGYSF